MLATCKDCIHYEVCKTEKGSTVFYREGLLESTYNQVDKLCGALFKDKSRFVELPYKIGDKAFRVAGNGEIEEGEVRGFFFGASGQTLEIAFSTEPEHCGVINEAFVKKTREEAERALREREA